MDDRDESTRLKIVANIPSAGSIRTPFGEKEVIYADTTASGIVYIPIERKIEEFWPMYANTHSNAHNGCVMADLLSQSLKIVKRCLNVPNTHQIIFSGNGATQCVTHLIHMLKINQDDCVIMSDLEHHSNILPWRTIGCEVKICPSIMDDDRQIGVINREALMALLNSTRKRCFVALTACSNVNGVVQDVDALCDIIHKNGGVAIFDYACGLPYMEIDVGRSRIDAAFMSPHKMLGGVGAHGVLVVRETLIKNEKPFLPGGGTVRYVNCDEIHYSKSIQTREMGGTPNVFACLRTGLAFSLRDTHLEYIQRQNARICRYVYGRMRDMKNILLLTPQNVSVPIFSFLVIGAHYNIIVVLLNDLFGIQTRGGISCCSLYAHKLDIVDKCVIKDSILGDKGSPSGYGWTRVSFNYLMSWATIDFVIDSIAHVAQEWRRYVPQYEFKETKNIYCHKTFSRKYPELKL